MELHHLDITWSKAYGEPYCHHASLFIPYHSTSLFLPEKVYIGVTVRKNIIGKGEITKSVDKRIAYYLTCSDADGGLVVPIISPQILEALSVNSWTTLKDNVRGSKKEFPINMFYKFDDGDEVLLPFDYEHVGHPYMLIEYELENIADGEKIDSVINFDI